MKEGFLLSQAKPGHECLQVQGSYLSAPGELGNFEPPAVIGTLVWAVCGGRGLTLDRMQRELGLFKC